MGDRAMNQTIKYLCEFFFCNFWHWLALMLLVAEIFGVRIYIKEKKK